MHSQETDGQAGLGVQREEDEGKDSGPWQTAGEENIRAIHDVKSLCGLG